MSEHYNTDYTREQIEEILNKIKACIQENKYIVALNDKRQENRSFIEKYNVYSTKLKAILLNLTIEDFCYSLNNLNPQYSDEILYVFVPILTLYDESGLENNLATYIKINLIEKSNSDLLIVISFHKLNKKVKYLFK